MSGLVRSPFTNGAWWICKLVGTNACQKLTNILDVCNLLNSFFFFCYRTQDCECGTHGAVVNQGETVPGVICDEERRPKLVNR